MSFLSTTIGFAVVYGAYLIFPFVYMHLSGEGREVLGDDYRAALQFVLLSIVVFIATTPLFYFVSLKCLKSKFRRGK